MLIWKLFFCFLIILSKKNFLLGLVTEDNFFECTKPGKFKNPNDLSCSKYYLCSLLEENVFNKTDFLCPVGFYFDDLKEECSKDFSCPDNANHNTDSSATKSKSSILVNEFSETLPEADLTVLSLRKCYISNGEEFMCTQKGRFLNNKDETCTTYFLCSQLRNGSFIQTEYSCPQNSWFDPELQICSIFYQCPCFDITTSTGTTIAPTETTDLESTSETEFSSFSLTPTTTESSKTCLAYKNYTKDFTCQKKGRFLDAKDETCTTYFLCSLLRNGSFIQTEYTCPINSWFDPELQICSVFYQCPCSIATSVTTTKPTKDTTISTLDTSTTEISTPTTLSSENCLAYKNYSKDFSCKEKGRFLNARDETCATYFLCSLLRNGSFIQTEYICPNNSWFDPELQICSIFYQCPCSTATSLTTTKLPTTETTTTSPSSEITSTKETSTPTTPSENCLANKNYSENFSCTEKGRFLNPKDETCTTYFLCSLLRNGSLIQTEYSCPVNSWFDPELQICSIFYECPCSTSTFVTTTKLPTDTTISTSTTLETSTTEISTPTTLSSENCLAYKNFSKVFSCKEKGRFLNVRDETCATYFLCSLLRNGSFIQTEYTCPINSWFDPELQICSVFYQCPCSTVTSVSTTRLPTTETTTSEITSTREIATPTTPIKNCLAYQNYSENFSCNEKGRFLNARDETCTTYFLCSLLRNGSFIRTEYICPINSWFDPKLQICSIFYECPCSATTSVTTAKPTTDTTVSISTTPDTSTTEISTLTTLSSGNCLAYKNYSKDFSCKEKGRFLNARDESCATYFLCSLLRNESFIQTEYICPSNSWFDPDLQICSIFYQCPCSPATSLTTTRLPTTETTTLETTSTKETSTSTTPTENCLAYKNYSENVSCKEKGRFLNPKDETCMTYFLCSLLRNGSFIQTEYVCPVNSWFDPELQICSIFYECPCSASTSVSTTKLPTDTTISTSITLEPSTTEISTPTTLSSENCLAYKNYSKDFSCKEKGRFLNASDETCSTYFLCSLLRNGSFIQTEYICPVNSWFDPELQICSIFYQCPCSTATSLTTTKLPTTETTTSSEITSTPTTPSENCLAYKNYSENFSCTEKGRFLNARDETCTTYFLCSLLRNGSFIQTEYICPVNSWFDPELQICSLFYECPCSTSTSLTTMKLPTDTTISTSTTLETSTTEISTPTTLSSENCPAYKNYSKEFSCKEKGRFLNARDETCATYFLCSLLRNGSFIQTEYICPINSWFDPELQICSIFYKCPCFAEPSLTTTRVPTTESTSLETTSTMEISTQTTPSENCLAYKNYSENFSCKEKGRFLNARDETCTTYFLCSLLRNGSFIQTEYICPVNSWFDPELQICSIFYECPCSISTSVTITKLPTDTTISTSTTLEPSTTEISTSTTPSENCLAYKNYSGKFSSCTEKGRFVNARDETCTTYFLCFLLRNGSFIQTEYICPVNSWFDPELQICSIFYECPCSTFTSVTTTKLITTDTTISASTTLEISTTEISLSTTVLDNCLVYRNYTKNFTCKEKGRFLNARDETCATYFLCSSLRNGSFIQTEYNCPTNSFFDPELQICSIFYQCPCTTFTTTNFPSIETETSSELTTLQTAVTTTPILTTPPNNCLAYKNYSTDFICKEKGRFLNARDETCATYFLCSPLRNGSFIQTEYSCPTNSWFDPELQICSVFYKCPCYNTTTPFETSTVPDTTTTPEISTATSDCDLPEVNDFICNKEGRFQNKMDVYCTSYYLCNLLRNGTFIQTKYFCPKGSYFDPNLQICNIEFECPCRLSV